MADSNMGELNAIVSGPGTGEVISLLGVQVLMKATKGDTAGQWALIEYSAPPQFRGPAPHWHKVMQEGFYVLEGTMTIRVGEESVPAPAGTFVFVPPGTVHGFSNGTDQPARMLVFMTPGGMEAYFAELAVLVKSEPSWPPADMSKVMELASRYDTYAPPGP